MGGGINSGKEEREKGGFEIKDKKRGVFQKRMVEGVTRKYVTQERERSQKNRGDRSKSGAGNAFSTMSHRPTTKGQLEQENGGCWEGGPVPRKNAALR